MSERKQAFLKGPSGAPDYETLHEIPAPSIKGNLMGDAAVQGIAVVLPKGYEESDKRYPVLYFLPGFGDDYQAYGEVFKQAMEGLSEAAASCMIVVCVNGKNRLNGSFYIDSPVTGNWGRFLTEDVIGYVDRHFRTIAEPDGRGLAGHSMGGFGTLHTVMTKPDLFSHAYCMSPASSDKGIEDTMIDLTDIWNLREEYQGLSREEARSRYLKFLRGIDWPRNVSFAYGAAFAPDSGGMPPWIALPERMAEGTFCRDQVFARFEMGFGGYDLKISQYKENLEKLKNLGIDFGEQDKYGFIPRGCRYISCLLAENGIRHTLTPYEGDHSDKVAQRIQEAVIPFFCQAFGEF